MKKTPNLNLPIYNAPETDIFNLEDWNNANNSIDGAYKEIIDFRTEIPRVNPSAELILARKGKPLLKDKIDEVDFNILNNLNELIGARKGKVTLKDKIDEVDSSLEQNKNEADFKINELATKGTTVEVLERVTKSEIDRQVADGTIATLTIKDNTIDKEKLMFDVLELEIGKNLFNYKTVLDGYYLAFGTNELFPNPSFCVSDFIRVKPNTKYIKNTNQQFCFYDKNRKYLSGIATADTFLTPSDCYFVRLTVEKASIKAIQLEEGEVQTTYEEYKITIKKENLPLTTNTQSSIGNFVVVSKTNGNYDTINGAINDNECSKNNPLTILLSEGIYEENVNTISKYVTIYGFNKDKTMITNKLNDYYHPPLDCGTNTFLYNITAFADINDSTKDNATPSYGMHFDLSSRVDYELESNQGKARFFNCNFIGTKNHGVGLGTCKNQDVYFDNCEIVSLDYSAFRCHNYPFTGHLGQRLTLKDCLFHSKNGNQVVTIQDSNKATGANDDNDTIFTFINCIGYNDINGIEVIIDTPTNDNCISGNIKKGRGSYGNNYSQLNR